MATSLFMGFGVARRLQGGASLRRRRLLTGLAVATLATAVSGGVFGGVAVANDLALRDMAVATSRFGPTQGAEPPRCDTPLMAGATARLHMTVAGTVDLKPIGTVDLSGLRVGDDYRWLAYVATPSELGEHGSARLGDRTWIRTPEVGWRAVPLPSVHTDTLDLQAVAVALDPGYRTTAEDRGVEVLEGARARRCRIAIDGYTFELAFPQLRWLVGQADLRRWVGQLDYWIFLDGEIGQVAASANGEAVGIVPDALQGTLDVLLTATERGRSFVVYPPIR
jgi:hypothetical protein